PDMMLRIGRDGTFVDYWPATDFRPAVPPSEFLGRNIAEVMPADFARRTMHYVERALATREVQSYEYQLTVDTEARDYEARLAALGRDEVLAVVRDMTERKRVEEERARLAAAIHQAGEAVVIVDPDLATTYVNPAFESLTGYTRAEVEGRDVRVLQAVEEAEHSQAMCSTLAREETWTGRLSSRRSDGRPYHVHAVTSPVHDSDGRLINYVSVQRDVTHEVALEEQLRQAQKLEAVGQLTSGIAHDLNNVLSVILGNAELAMGALDPRQRQLREDLADIEAAAHRGAAMVSKLLGFARRAELFMLPTDLGQLVANLSGMMRQLLPEDIEVIVHTYEPVDTVRADGGAVEQILLNLATNARDAMPEGGTLRIEVRQTAVDEAYRATHPWAEPGQYVSVAVSDTGLGMDKETKAKLFDPFFTTKPPGVGTGLGMAMVYGLVMQHQGLVHVYSEVGEGTTVRVYFPVLGEEAVIRAAAEEAPVEIRGGNETILLIEDDPALRRTGNRLLAKLGYRVLTAADGEEGLVIYHAHQSEIDLIISDLVMPKLGGRGVFDAIRRKGGTVKFLFSTGYSSRNAEERGALEPAVPILRKPWTVEQMARVVRDTLDAS
ncbi:MAG: PAS domain S-box protein, partial [Gemmatimonadales bacterium]